LRELLSLKEILKKHGNLDSALIEVLYKLINDEPLPAKYQDHSLNGNWKNYKLL
jgi:mRNA interferase YafQ